MTILARVGPWPVVSQLIAYGGRLWFANSVKGVNHNSADLYSLAPGSAKPRYERHLFSQDAGDPLVAGGLLYWPFEDPRISVGWGHIAVTDGSAWRLQTVDSARMFHVHAMASLGQRLIAATSAWRAGVQISDDGGASWRQIYDHPTPARRVSRIVRLASAGAYVYGQLIDRGRQNLLRSDGARVEAVAGWPEGLRIQAMAAVGQRLLVAVNEDDGGAIWAVDGSGARRVHGPSAGWWPADMISDGTRLWAATSGRGTGRLWSSADGRDWQPEGDLTDGEPWSLAFLNGQLYGGGKGSDGRGIFWGPKTPASAAVFKPTPPIWPLRRAKTAQESVDWKAEGRELDRLLSADETYRVLGRRVRNAIYRLARAGPPAGFLGERLRRPMPTFDVALIGGKVRVPAAQLGQWAVLWSMALSGRAEVPPALLAVPWTPPQNNAEKYLEPVLAALWAIAWSAQRDPATLAALVKRLDAKGDPDWVTAQVVGTLSAVTGERFGHNRDAWRAWWRRQGR